MLAKNNFFVQNSSGLGSHFLTSLIVAGEEILKAGPDVSVDAHVEAGVDQTVEVGEDDQVGYQFNILFYPHHENDSVGPPAQQESCSN